MSLGKPLTSLRIKGLICKMRMLSMAQDEMPTAYVIKVLGTVGVLWEHAVLFL